jgi:hypothetical protein
MNSKELIGYLSGFLIDEEVKENALNASIAHFSINNHLHSFLVVLDHCFLRLRFFIVKRVEVFSGFCKR